MANDNSLITERQVAFLSNLVRKKDLDNTRLTEDQRVWLLAGDYSSMSKAQASKAIKLLLELGDKPVEPTISIPPHHPTVNVADRTLCAALGKGSARKSD